MFKCRNVCILIVCLLMHSAWPVKVCASDQDQGKLKAEYILNLARFTRWPESAFRLKPETIDICVYRSHDFAGQLMKLSGRSVKRRKLDVLVVEEVKDLENCHIVYITKYDKSSYTELMGEMEKRGILSVGDVRGFVEEGGLVEFVEVNGKTKFILNVKKAQEIGIGFKTELIEIAEQIR